MHPIFSIKSVYMTHKYVILLFYIYLSCNFYSISLENLTKVNILFIMLK